MRRPLIVGAQKLYLVGPQKAREFAEGLIEAVRNRHFDFDIVVCPSLINLAHMAEILKESGIGIGAQNVHQESNGAFTGQVSAQELQSVGTKYVIVGHSELRMQQGERNEIINAKIKICLGHGLIPIVCVGETKEERNSGRSKEVIERDIKAMFRNISLDDSKEVIIAYEPVWAIQGMNKDAEPAKAGEANDMHEFIRDILSSLYGSNIAWKTRILYGGSVNSENAGDFLKEPSIDGLLVGSASKEIKSCLAVLESAQKVVSKKASNSTKLHLQSA